jgi:hypothetical protein
MKTKHKLANGQWYFLQRMTPQVKTRHTIAGYGSAITKENSLVVTGGRKKLARRLQKYFDRTIYGKSGKPKVSA